MQTEVTACLGKLGRLLLFYCRQNQADNADEHKAVLEQIRKRYVHGHPSPLGGKKKCSPPGIVGEANRLPLSIAPYVWDYSMDTCACL